MAVTFKVVSKRNGGTYIIGENKFNSEPNDWILDGESVAPISIAMPLELEVAPVEDIPYKTLKGILAKRGVEFKGNASKEQLMNLLNES